MCGGTELREKQRKCWNEPERNLQWSGFRKQNWDVCFGGRSPEMGNAWWLDQGAQWWRTRAETEGNEKGNLERSFHSFCLSVCDKGVTEWGVIEHARRKGRGRGWWENGIISIGLIHHGDWRCLHTGAVGFVLAKYYGSCVGVTKLLGRNCVPGKRYLSIQSNAFTVDKDQCQTDWQLICMSNTLMLLVTDHTYCYGCDDEYAVVLPTVPNSTDLWESHSVPHSNSTKINHSTFRLRFLPNYKGTALHVPTVKPSTRFRSLYVILLCFYLFQSPNFVITKLGQFISSYSLTY